MSPTTMEVLISIIPGMAFSCSLFLLLISSIQYRIYRKKAYEQSKAIALFCLFAALFSWEHFIVQTRAFPPVATHLYIILSTVSLCISLVYYLKSLSFFLAIPNWLYSLHQKGMLILAAASFVSLPAYLFFDIELFFNSGKTLMTPNYFINSYTTRIGSPVIYIDVVLSLSGFLVAFSSVFILRNVLKSSRDVYFIIGLSFSIFASLLENFLLPFTYEYFFPVIFLANLFEAHRMNSLSIREYTKEKKNAKKVNEEIVDTEKYQNSNLSEERISELSNKVIQALTQNKLYTNPNLNSEDLAKKVGVPSYQLSQVINIGLNITFFELLSSYRIEEVKQKLQDPKLANETIINIAYDSGFNSKSSFNTAFKKKTGSTPSAYRKEWLNKEK